MKNAKKFTSIVLAIVMLLSTFACVPFSAFAYSVFQSDGYDYWVLDNGTAEIIAYYDDGINLTIPSKLAGYTVTSIGDYAFSNLRDLESVTIPNTVKSIGYEAFYACYNLKTVTMANSVKSIGKEAFCQCENLKNLTISKSVNSIGAHAFDGCKSLTTITIPNGVNIIERGVFANCESLTSIVIPNNVKSIEKRAFANCSNLKSVTISNSVTSIGESAFDTCESLASITIPDSVKNIDALAFFRCYALKKITIPKSVTTIVGAFSYSGIESIYILNSKCKISNDSFGLDSIPSGATIYGYKYSTAETYAKDYCKNFKLITEEKTTLLNVPKNLSVSNTTSGVKISWGKVKDAEKYRIYYKTGNGSWKKLADTTSTSYTWKKAKKGTKYSFTVRCISSDGKTYTSDYDKTGKSITYTPALATPKLSSVSNTTTGVKISWGKVAGAAKYRIFYKTGNGKWKKLTDTTSTSYTWKKAKSGTKYSFTVRCISKDGKSYTSAYDTKGKSITFVSAPKISKLSKTSSGIKISWGKVSGAAKYRIFYKTANGKWKKFADTTSTSYTWKGAKKGTNYSFTVRCISKDGKTYTSAYDTKGKSIKR